jgi:hypothetical protein
MAEWAWWSSAQRCTGWTGELIHDARSPQGFSNNTRNSLPLVSSGGQRAIVSRCRKPARVNSVTTIDAGMP